MRRWLGDHVPTKSYIIGTEADYQKAVKNWERDRAKMEAKQYAEHVANVVDVPQQQIKALEALKSVCHTFDGKVINKRFNEAVKAATGFNCIFKDDSMNLYKYSCAGPYRAIQVYLYYRWYGKMENFWQWTKGDRMEAEKAVSIIDIKINDLQENIKRLQGTKKRYAKYVAKVKNYREKIGIWIISNHTSCDGFWSFLSNHIKDWNRTALFNHKSDHQEAYLAYILYYIMLAECGFSEADSDRLDLWASDYVSEQVSITEFITYPGNNKAA